MDMQAFRKKVREHEEEARSVISTEKRPLWCVATEEWNPLTHQWELSLRYSHADTLQEAKMTYCRARCDPYGRVLAPYRGLLLDPRLVDGKREIFVAQVFGYKSKDDNGTKLVA